MNRKRHEAAPLALPPAPAPSELRGLGQPWAFATWTATTKPQPRRPDGLRQRREPRMSALTLPPSVRGHSEFVVRLFHGVFERVLEVIHDAAIGFEDVQVPARPGPA